MIDIKEIYWAAGFLEGEGLRYGGPDWETEDQDPSKAWKKKEEVIH